MRQDNCLSVRRVALGAEGLVVGRFGTDGIRCSRQQIRRGGRSRVRAPLVQVEEPICHVESLLAFDNIVLAAQLL